MLRNEAELLDYAHGLEVGRMVEGVPAHEQEFVQGASKGCDVKPLREVREREAVEESHNVVMPSPEWTITPVVSPCARECVGCMEG